MCTKSKETIKRSASRNIRFVEAALSVVKSARIAPYSSKYSKKIYTQPQILVLILFKDYRNQHYRDFIGDIGDMEQIQQVIDLPTIPHFTTLQKFLRRIKSLYLRVTFGKTLSLFYSDDSTIPITSIDSSGLEAITPVTIIPEEPVKREKRFLKTTISVDTDRQIITGLKIS